jgi:hypothetical protein
VYRIVKWVRIVTCITTYGLHIMMMAMMHILWALKTWIRSTNCPILIWITMHLETLRKKSLMKKMNNWYLLLEIITVSNHLLAQGFAWILIKLIMCLKDLVKLVTLMSYQNTFVYIQTSFSVKETKKSLFKVFIFLRNWLS